ncbi:MAG TPA: cytochrome c-type biogenesis protein [Vicinamibacteria bacterium]|nr:cytochrome c-type biogenesis protein [Vicinamibacteria bacterium]
MKRTAVLLVLLLAPLAAAQTPPDHTPVDLAHAASIAGPPRAPRLTGAALEAEAKHIAAVLRCPVCQGLSVGDSPSAMATNMRQQIRELVAAGFDEDQILSYFEASYGEFVRLQPPLRGVNWLVWIAPGLGLLLGLGVVCWVLRGASTETSEAVAATEPSVEVVPDPLPDDPALAKAVLRVRELAYGWPGGVRPGKA